MAEAAEESAFSPTDGSSDGLACSYGGVRAPWPSPGATPDGSYTDEI